MAKTWQAKKHRITIDQLISKWDVETQAPGNDREEACNVLVTGQTKIWWLLIFELICFSQF